MMLYNIVITLLYSKQQLLYTTFIANNNCYKQQLLYTTSKCYIT